jgi:hypothetical protein
MVNSGALDAIINLMSTPSEVVGDPSADAEVVKIAVYALGNVCRHRACRERVASRKLKPILDDLARRGDDTLKKYVLRVKNKLTPPSAVS